MLSIFKHPKKIIAALFVLVLGIYFFPKNHESDIVEDEKVEDMGTTKSTQKNRPAQGKSHSYEGISASTLLDKKVEEENAGEAAPEEDFGSELAGKEKNNLIYALKLEIQNDAKMASMLESTGELESANKIREKAEEKKKQLEALTSSLSQ